MTMITDGTGSNLRAKVTSKNKLAVDAVVEDTFVNAAENGLAFNINTEALTYAGTAPYEQGCLYIKNNETADLEIVGFFIGELNDRSGGSTATPLLFTMYGNPTGSIGGNVVTVVNRKIGAPRSFDVECYSQPTGWAVTGAPLLYQYQYGGRSFGTVTFNVPAGQSILLSVTSNTDSFTAYTGFTGYISE